MKLLKVTEADYDDGIYASKMEIELSVFELRELVNLVSKNVVNNSNLNEVLVSVAVRNELLKIERESYELAGEKFKKDNPAEEYRPKTTEEVK